MVTVEEGLNWKNSIILRDERFYSDRAGGVEGVYSLQRDAPSNSSLAVTYFIVV